MLIDWFTVCAQAVNFLILVWLLKRFLYKPILDAINAREKLIAAELTDAAAKKAEAQKDRDEFQHKNEEFDQQRAALLTQATTAANAERQRLLVEARKAADEAGGSRQETLRSETQHLYQTITRQAGQEVFAIARRTLADLADLSLEERISDVFMRRLHEMNDSDKHALGETLTTAPDPAILRSTFDLPAAQRAAIQNALNVTFSAEVRVQFQTSPDFIGGIELTTNGQKVAWSIASYLASIEKGVDELLKENNEARTKPAVEADQNKQGQSNP
jgi:F-type H+-transporting ATPase subunit b